LRSIFPPPEEFDLRAAIAPDGLTFATLTTRHTPKSMDGADVQTTIRLWDVPFAKEYLAIGSDREGLEHPVEELIFSTDSRWLATSHSNRSAVVWDTRTGRDVLTIRGLESQVKCLAFSLDGRRLATGHADGTALIWAVPPESQQSVSRSKAELDELWTALGDADTRRARSAMAKLAASPKDTVAFLADRVTPAPAFPVDKIPGLLKDLSDGRFAKREAATKALASLGERVESYLTDYLATRPPPEGQRRAERLLVDLAPGPSRETLRRTRAIPVLAWINDAESRAILTRLTTGDPTMRETQAAHAALRASR
jgi:hypothetical protein